MESQRLQEGERAIVIDFKGDPAIRSYLQTYGITIGSIFFKNYSPTYADLVNISISGKMLSLRKADYKMIEWTRI